MTGATDNRFFRRAGSVGYGFGLFSKRLAFEDYATMFHGNDERVDQESLQPLDRALARDRRGVRRSAVVVASQPRLLEALLAEVLLERLGEVVAARDLLVAGAASPRSRRRRRLLLERARRTSRISSSSDDRLSTRALPGLGRDAELAQVEREPVNAANRSSSARVAGGFGGVAT